MVQRTCTTMENDKINLESYPISQSDNQAETSSKFSAQPIIGHYKLQQRQWSPLSSQRSISSPNLNGNRETSFINHDSTGYNSCYPPAASVDLITDGEEEDHEVFIKHNTTQRMGQNMVLTPQLIARTGTATAKRPQNVPGIPNSSHKRLKSDSPYIIGTALVDKSQNYGACSSQQQPIKTSAQEGCFLVECLSFDGEDNMLSNTRPANNNGDNNTSGANPSNELNLNDGVEDNNTQNVDGTESKEPDTTNVTVKRQRTVSKEYKRTDFGDYYPDGGWGWVVCIGAAIVHFLMYGIHFSGGTMYVAVSQQFTEDTIFADWLCSVSFGLCHIIAPLVVAWCRRHSPRLLALAGALATGLACLFMSFATKGYQVFISYSIVFAIASGIVIHTSTVMVARFFHCRRDCVEIVCMSVSGIGMVGLTNYLYFFVSHIPWSRGTQLLGCAMILVCASVATYRSSALYHPRRRAIVHLKRTKKTQKQLKDFENRPTYWDLSPLCMCSFRVLLLCAFFTGMGYYVPFMLLPAECDKDNFDQHSKLVALSFLGISFSLGVSSCGLLVLHSSQKCLVAKQYLCLTSGCMCGITTMLFAMAHEIKAYILFVVVFGLSSGAFIYSFKLYVVELVTRKLAEVGLGYMYACFGMGIVIGTPVFVLLSTKVVYIRASFIAAGMCMFLGSGLLFILTLTSNHPSNHRVIKSAYLKSKMAEEEVLFDEMNISNSEDSMLSDSDAAAGSKSPSFHWSEYAEGSISSVSDKATKYLTDDAISANSVPDSPVQQFCQKSHIFDTLSGGGGDQDSQTPFLRRDSPPKYNNKLAGVPNDTRSDTISKTSFASNNTQSKMHAHTHSALAPGKSTYV